VAAGSISQTTARISWNTNKASSSQVAYGPTTAYGSASTLDSSLVTSHTVTLSGLSPSTTYNYQVLSRDGQGNLVSSANFTFATTAGPQLPPVLLHLKADAGEVSGTTNNSVVTPTVAPAGFTGTVAVKGGGSVNFAPAFSGNGVYFRNCCDNTSTAYYRFTGSAVGSIFNLNQGQISFYLRSRYSFSQRTSASQARFAFDVRDGGSNHPFFFRTQVSSGLLQFSYATGGVAQFYFVPTGTEETLFGNNVTMKVTIEWDGTTSRLLLNDIPVQTASYSKQALNWTSSSVFAFGAYDYLTYGAYNVLDDIVDEFIVRGK